MLRTTCRLARGLYAGRTLLPLLVALTAAACLDQAESAQFKILKAFDGGVDGGSPSAGVIAGPDGTLYGTTTSGGSTNCSTGCGTIFQLTPPGPSQAKWKHTVLYRFTAGADGFWPISGLLLDAAGALYGTATAGVGNLWGNVFKLTPPAPSVSKAAVWKFSILNNLNGGGNGSNPLGAPLMDQDGIIYASASMGGDNGHGTAFKLTPPTSGKRWKAATLFSFAGSDGDFPTSNLTLGPDGSLYGTTRIGGDSDAGTVFRLTPSEHPNRRWKRTVLHHFAGGADGTQPEAGVVIDQQGSLYGTTQAGGGGGGGTLFMLTPPQPGKNLWKHSVLFNFPFDDTGAGRRPLAALTIGPGGTILGTTDQGGSAVFGTVFRLTPPATDKAKQWTHTVLHNFAGGTDGAFPDESGVVIGLDSALYGTTRSGAGSNFGGVYKLVP